MAQEKALSDGGTDDTTTATGRLTDFMSAYRARHSASGEEIAAAIQSLESLVPDEVWKVDNPYWAEVRGGLSLDMLRGDLIAGDSMHFGWDDPRLLIRDRFVSKYAWTITDPMTLSFVKEFCGPAVVDPMAGTGYWGYLLEQLGVDVVSYDADPGENFWHSGAQMWTGIWRMDGAESVAKHPDRTLLLAWPPYATDDGYRTLTAYEGSRVIYVGESGGCTGDDQLLNALDGEESQWVVATCYKPVQWMGMHDYVTVYERKQ